MKRTLVLWFIRPVLLMAVGVAIMALVCQYAYSEPTGPCDPKADTRCA